MASEMSTVATKNAVFTTSVNRERSARAIIGSVPPSKLTKASNKRTTVSIQCYRRNCVRILLIDSEVVALTPVTVIHTRDPAMNIGVRHIGRLLTAALT